MYKMGAMELPNLPRNEVTRAIRRLFVPTESGTFLSFGYIQSCVLGDMEAKRLPKWQWEDLEGAMAMICTALGSVPFIRDGREYYPVSRRDGGAPIPPPLPQDGEQGQVNSFISLLSAMDEGPPPGIPEEFRDR